MSLKNIIFFLLISSLLLNCSILFAQTDTVMIEGQTYVKKVSKPKIDKRKFNALFTEANLMMMENFHDTALKTFLILHEMDPTNANINFKIGQLYLSSSSEKSKAVDYLEAAAPGATRNYIPDEPSERECPELIYYLLGQAYHLVYRFDEALAMFEKFSKHVNMADMNTANDLKRKIEITKTAQALVSSPIKCTITNLGDSINSEYPDYGAIITADESQLFFTSRRFNIETGGNDNRTDEDKYYEDIWVSNKNEDGSWGKVKPLSTHINSWNNEAVVGISPDGQQLFYNKNDQDGSIYYSKLQGDQWSYGYMMGTDAGDITDINSPSYEPSACISPDGNTLYFVSDRAGGFGGTDIYKCVKLPTGRWSKATNLGPTINTKYNEDAPFMHPDGVTLFFSSNGHKTMGGFDIFLCMLFEEGWSPPQNMGYPINTTDDDIFYVMSTDGKRAYFSSVRAEGFGEKDLYMVTLPQRMVMPVTLMKGYISFGGKKDSMMTYVTISATDIETGQVAQEVHPNTRTMKYLLPLNPGRTGKTYAVKYDADGYRPYTEIISASPEGEYKEVDRNYDFKKDVIMETSKMQGTISVSGTLTDKEKEPLMKKPKITVIDNLTGGIVGTYTPDNKGVYYFNLPRGNDYNISYEADGYLFQSENIKTPKDKSHDEIKKNIQLEKIKKGAKVVLNNIFFDSGKATLRKESNVELDKLVKLLVDLPNIKVEIGGHTDNAGKPDANLKLSQSRADAVTQYIIIKGVDRARLIAQGYGDAQPVASNVVDGKPNPNGMQMNRRVEFKILEN